MKKRTSLVCLITLIAILVLPTPVALGSMNQPFEWPSKGTVLTSYSVGVHRGIDLETSAGDSVKAAGDGVVRWVGKTPRGEPVVSIEHFGGLISTYIPVEGSPGQGTQVSQGEVIGVLADTGEISSPIPHLHFSLYREDGGNEKQYLDPLDFLPPLLEGVFPAEGAAVQATVPQAQVSTSMSRQGAMVGLGREESGPGGSDFANQPVTNLSSKLSDSPSPALSAKVTSEQTLDMRLTGDLRDAVLVTDQVQDMVGETPKGDLKLHIPSSRTTDRPNLAEALKATSSPTSPSRRAKTDALGLADRNQNERKPSKATALGGRVRLYEDLPQLPNSTSVELVDRILRPILLALFLSMFVACTFKLRRNRVLNSLCAF